MLKKHIYSLLIVFLINFTLHAQSTPAPSVSKTKTSTRTTVREIEKTIDGKKWNVNIKNDTIDDVKINGKAIPKTEWARYASEIEQLRGASLELNQSNAQKGSLLKITEEQINTNADSDSEEDTTIKTIEDEMLNDKLVENRAYSLLLTEKMMTINGKTMSPKIADKYINIYYKYSNERRCEGCTFKIQINKQTK